MFSFLSVEHIALLLLGILVVVLMYIATQSERRFRKLTTPIYDQVIKRAQGQAEEITRKATEESQKMRRDAESRINTYVEEHKEQVRHREQKFEQQLEQFADTVKTSLTDYQENYIHRFEKINGYMKETISDAIARSVNKIQKTTDELDKNLEAHATRLEESLGSVKSDYADEIKSILNEELEKANKAVDAYREERMKIVDNEIALLVEKTTQLTLQKKLTAQEHADLIHEALDEAKQEGVFDNT